MYNTAKCISYYSSYIKTSDLGQVYISLTLPQYFPQGKSNLKGRHRQIIDFLQFTPRVLRYYL